MYADVIFPIRLTPLTYKIPDGLSADIRGKIVTAPLMNKLRFGLVIEVREELDSKMLANNPSRIREVEAVHFTFAHEKHLKFLQWLSQYYLTPLGLALKSSFFEEAVAVSKTSGSPPIVSDTDSDTLTSSPVHSASLSPVMISEVIRAINGNAYSALLYHAPNLDYEYSSVIEVLRQTAAEPGGVTVLVPEVGFIGRLEPELRALFGDRLAVLHAKMTRKERILTIRNILDGKCDVIIGTRSAMLAPIPNLRFVAVIEEQSSSYKGEEGLRYNARDLAVMRAYIEKACVMLLSICPSIETIYNSQRGKYRNLTGTPQQTEIRRPRVKIIPFRTKKQSEFSLSSDVITEARSHLQRHEQVLFLVGRKGYSLIRCEDCGHIEYCEKCESPMIFYKSTGMIKCHHCGGERRTAEHCYECRGTRLSAFTAGTERVSEDVASLLKSPALQTHKTKVLSPTRIDFECNNHGLTDFVPFIIGTSGIKRSKCLSGKYSAAVLMNIDLLIARPDFRAHERAFQEILEVSQLVKPEGSLLIQTKSSGSRVLKCLKHYDFDAFYEMELAQRKEIAYPPYEKIVLFSILTRTREAISAATWQAVRDIRDSAVTVLGPLEVTSHSKSYSRCDQIILKSADNRRLHDMAKAFLELLEKNKKIRVVVDVDPLKI